MPLRPYQLDALTAIKENLNAGKFRQLAAMATGTGKTVIFANLPEHLGQSRGLVIVHRKELAQQAADKISHWNPTLRVGIEMGDSFADDRDDIVVASVQSLASPARIQKYAPDRFAWVVVDEAHHAVSPSYTQVLGHFGLLLPGSQRLLLGVTATPNRGDGEALTTVFEKQVYQLSMHDAVTQGWLSEPRGIKVTTNTSLDGVHTRAGDFAQNELEEVVNTLSRNTLILKAWKEQAEDRQTIAFTVDIQHAKDLAAVFQAHGVRAEAVWGTDPDRDQKLADHRRGELKVLTNANVLTEGYDDWRIGCIVMAKPTKSQLAFVQMAGRGTRNQEGIANRIEAEKSGITLVKKDCLLMDVVDNTSKHSLATLASVFGMNAKLNMRGRSAVAVKRELEALQQQYPAADINQIDDVNKIQAKIESVDLWKVRYPEEVVKEAQLSWHKTPDGDYVLYMTADEGVRVWEDLLGSWSVFLHMNDSTLHEENFKSRKEALAWAERMVALHDKKRYHFLKRSWKSADEPASRPQLSMLRGLRIPHAPTVSKQEASQLITQYKAKTFNLNLGGGSKDAGLSSHS